MTTEHTTEPLICKRCGCLWIEPHECPTNEDIDNWDKQEIMEDTLQLWMAWVYRDLIAPDTRREREHGQEP